MCKLRKTYGSDLIAFLKILHKNLGLSNLIFRNSKFLNGVYVIFTSLHKK